MELIVVDYQREFVSFEVVGVDNLPIVSELDSHYTEIVGLQRHCTKFEIEE